VDEVTLLRLSCTVRRAFCLLYASHSLLCLQEGSVDEVSFVAAELGDLAAIMVAPEGGSWMCDEVDVSSSRTSHTDR
jgi:hypothetical protein